jgi:hypothetical protein
MKRNWELDDLIDHFTIMPNEMTLMGNKTGVTRLGFAVLLKFFQLEKRFPYAKNEIPKDVVSYIAKQLQLIGVKFEDYDLNSRTHYYHKEQIREFLGFREVTAEDANNLTEWLSKYVFYHDAEFKIIKEEAYKRLIELHIEPPTVDRIDRIVKTSINIYEDQFFTETYSQLSSDSINQIDGLIDNLMIYNESELDENVDEGVISFNDLRSDPGNIGVDSFFKEVAKLQTIKLLNLPDNLFSKIPIKIIKKYKTRAVSEKLTELRRHPQKMRYTILAAFFWLRKREITDNLIELLIKIIHRIGVKAEKKVDKELLNDFRKVNNKSELLYHIAEIAVDNPDGIIKEVLYPVVNEQTLKALVKEFKNSGVHYRQKVHAVMRASYSNHYRVMVPELLNILEFRSNNNVHRPVIKALELIKKYTPLTTRYFNNDKEMPIDGVVKPGMKETVIEKDENGKERINRINYEIVVLQALRDKLRCKEIWVVGANHYRNPDDDLPADFQQRREENYNALNQPLDSEEFISSIKKAMHDALSKLDNGMPKNTKVHLLKKEGGWIKLSPFEAQEEPSNLTKIKADIMRQWPMINLLDILKESDLRISFTEDFKTMATHEKLDRDTIQKRLILALYGLGTNTGL